MRHNDNAAYDYSQFEEQSAQTSDIKEVAKKKHHKKNINVLKSLFYVLIGVLLASSLLYCKAMQVELEAEHASLINQISVLKSENTGMQIKLESKLSLSKIEEYAKNELGLEKLDDQKIEYINFSESDKAEVIKSKNFFEKIIDNIKELFI